MPEVTAEHECSCDRRVSITSKYLCVAKHWPPQHHAGKHTTETTTPKKLNEDSPNTQPTSQLNTASQGTLSLTPAGPVYPCSKNYINSLLCLKSIITRGTTHLMLHLRKNSHIYHTGCYYSFLQRPTCIKPPEVDQDQSGCSSIRLSQPLLFNFKLLTQQL